MSSEDFVRASSNNLPIINMFMVMTYIKNDERFNSSEFSNVKASASTREEYGDNAVGYVELKRDNTKCIMRCKICPEHRIRTKNYSVVMEIDEEEEKIINVECEDCAASAGGCKHALAFIMWAYRRTEEPAPTEVESYWKRPVLSTITDNKALPVSSFLKSVSANGSTRHSTTFKESVIQYAHNIFENPPPIYRYNKDNIDDQWNKIFLHRSLCIFVKEGGTHAEDFLLFSLSRCDPILCIEAEKSTRAQKDSPLWHEIRVGRITASILYEFSRYRSPEGILIERLLGGSKIKMTSAMARGIKLEKEVLRCVEQQEEMKFNECGIFVIPHMSIFAASPDAISKDFVVEIKCPASEKAMKNYIKDGEITKKYRAQISLQMLAAGKKEGIFCVADPNFEKNQKVTTIHVAYDADFLSVLLRTCEENWKKYIFPKLIESAS